DNPDLPRNNGGSSPWRDTLDTVRQNQSHSFKLVLNCILSH
ncbi:hypothetical protein LEMLEM_LOCUS4854, partial [Lemmus lemmus]